MTINQDVAEPRDSELEDRVAQLNAQFEGCGAKNAMEYALSELGRVAVVSSFGAESVVLLHLVAQINPAAPILFIDTEMLFEETLTYQQDIAATLGLTGILVFRAGTLLRRDPGNLLHKTDPDKCCQIRKFEPLQTALAPYEAWISGRKRHQAQTRTDLDLFEADTTGGRIKINPLANWSARDLQGYIVTHDLPQHPLISKGYPSIGCAPCTSPVSPGEDPRAGRWRNQDKTECGIHFTNGKVTRLGATP